LRRTRSGPFSVDDAIPVASLEPGVHLRPALEGLADLSAVAVTGDERARIARGQAIDAASGAAGDERSSRAVLVDEHRQILAIAERQDASWAPRVVLIDA
jgi:tRNA U55 pseudouridine synthase TruB